ncbi:MAG: hypothetical protein EA364_14005 [Balneolaceae bacterium]|nr:MAG: hypothetical protein EA364_14005 [Balneolaceae bacterium]
MNPSIPPIEYDKTGNGQSADLPAGPIVSGSKTGGAWLEYEKTANGFILRNDPLGLQTIYYHETDKKLGLNTDIAVLAKKLRGGVDLTGMPLATAGCL